MPNQTNKQSNKKTSSKQPEEHKKFGDMKKFVKDYLQNYKEEINDSRRNSIKVLPLTLEDIGITPVALELIENKTGKIDESLDEQTKRETITSAVQQLIENVETDKQFVVVKVNTPAVDLNKVFAKDELKFMKKDIFKSIQNQLGGDLPEDVQGQWETAFNTMMNIVEAEKRKEM